MTSKSLYWAKWKENIKRRGWTFVLCFVGLFLFFPVVNIIVLNNMQRSLEEAAQYYEMNAEELARYVTDMKEVLAGNLGFSVSFGLCMALFAILFAVQGFSFLYSRRKMDLYMSVPVSGPKRFIMLWANGILMFFLCYLPNLILTWGIGAAFGVMDAELLAGSVLAFFGNMIAFTAMYQLALLAVLLTGNVLTALLGCSVLFVYEWIVRVLFGELKSRFFISYCRADQNRLNDLPLFTPFCGYLNLGNRIQYEGSSISGYGSYGYFSYVYETNWCSALFTEGLLLLLAAFVLGAIVYLVFRKRKTESYNQSVAFPGMKGVLEFFLLVPFSLAVSLLVCDMADDENFFLFAGAFGGLLIGHGIIQLIYERDLKAVIRKKGVFFTSLAATALVLVLFRFDLTGFDSYFPKREKIESVSVSLETDYDNFGWRRLEGSTDASLGVDRLLGQMNSSDTATVDAVFHMVETWQKAGMPTGADNTYSARMNEAVVELTADGSDTGQEREPWEDSNWFVVRYNLTDGRSVYRRFLVDASLCGEDLNTVMNDASYRNLRYQIYTDEFERAADSMKIVYFDGKQELLYTTDKKELLAALRRDFESYDFELIDTQLPCGVLRFSMPDTKSYRGYDWSYPVYESFSDTIRVLAENDIAAGTGESILAPEDVKEITVSYYVYDDAYEQDAEIFETGEVPEQLIVCTFEEKEEIAQILEGMYTVQLADAAGEEFKRVAQYEPRFSVSVSLTPEAMKNRYTADDLFFLKGRVPQFVIKKIKESAVRG